MGDAAGPLDAGIAGLRAAYLDGLDPRDVVQEVARRIGASDDPAVWIDVEPLDRLTAAAAELSRDDLEHRPLWGVPFAVKDNIDVAGRVTTGGVPGLARTASATATVVQRLLDAGGLYVGKTNLDQLATGLVGTRSPYGTPRNPLDATLVPGGSSSGSAVAVALGHVPCALATDTAGSGRVPAALCGIVGAKGVPGGQPLDGVLPASPSIDCVSTFAGSVADALLVDGVVGAAPWSSTSGPLAVAIAPGVDAGPLPAPHVATTADLALFHEAGDLLYGGPWLADRTAALAEVLEAAPAGLVDVVRTVVEGGARYRGTEVFAAQRRLAAIRSELAGWWAEVDVLVVPTLPFAPTLAEVALDPIGTNLALGRNTTFANLLGLAAVTVPAPDGPGGVTVLGPAWRRPAVATVAAAWNGEERPDGPVATRGRTLLAVVGAHLTGQPLNHELTSRGAELVARTATAPRYRLYRLAGGAVQRPALERVARGGRAIELEVWSLDDAGLGAVVAGIAPPLGIGSVELLDGRWVRGFVCEPHGFGDATDITVHGGWRAYLQAAARA